MKQQIYAIYDSCAGIYDSPHFANSDDIVRRQFQDIATAADNPISKHPEHYSLWRLGGWDNTNGKIINESNECLWQALEAISQSQMISEGSLREAAAETHPNLGNSEDAQSTQL